MARKRMALILAAAVLFIVIAVSLFAVLYNAKTSSTMDHTITLTSPDFPPDGMMPTDYTCKGENVSPPLIISHVPSSAKSLALVLHDPDAPSGTFYHWLMWNIPPSTTEISNSGVPTGALEGTNDFGLVGYSGPCPPSGTHHYIFTLYALNAIVDIKQGAHFSELKQQLDRHAIASTTYTGIYSAN